jgi:hypothetical protein
VENEFTELHALDAEKRNRRKEKVGGEKADRRKVSSRNLRTEINMVYKMEDRLSRAIVKILEWKFCYARPAMLFVNLSITASRQNTNTFETPVDTSNAGYAVTIGHKRLPHVTSSLPMAEHQKVLLHPR